MKRNEWLIELAACLLALLASCTFGDEPGMCPYNTRLEYWYAENTSVNELPTYVDNVRQYLFDGEGRLLGTTSLKRDSVAGWQTDLPPGNYTIVVWGNVESGNKDPVEVSTGENAELKDLILTSVTDAAPPGYRGNTGRLYYGYGQFEVEEGRVARKRVYLSHAHASLNVTVQWMVGQPEDGQFTMRLRGIPAGYGFIKGWESPLPSGKGSYAVPWISQAYTHHEVKAAMNYDGEVTGEIVSFRYTASTHPYWSLWRNGVQIIRDLDLSVFFNKLPMDMDRNIEQEFDILVTVYENKIVVTQASATDWDEGGVIG